ncbi:MAG: F420-dependent oxidoreductase [Candidatus Tectimicrobiota bacterium]|nr:MAG: F420-dependent oxidoreductase [Candidatus Tectomicrobia bacterium]
MRFGIVLPIWQLSLAEATTLALKAEELGFDGVFVPDHILAKPATTQHYGPSWPDPFALLAYFAGRTQRLQVGTSVVVLPYRHPLVTAKAAATVDQVSGGRFVFGVGVGWDAEEFQDLGLPFAERGAMTDEYLRIIKSAWSHDTPHFEGRYFRFGGATFAPRPQQQPAPPIWVGGAPGTLSSPALRRAATLGDAWHPLGLSLDDLERGAARLAELARQAGRAGAVGLAPRHLLQFTPAPQGSGRAAFAGTAEEVAADVRRVAALGADYLTFDLPRTGVADMVQTMERFVRDVKPALD